MMPASEPTLAKGIQLIQAGDFAQATDVLEAVLQTAPDDLTALNALAFSASRLRQHKKAIKAIRHALELAPDSFEIAQNYSLLLSEAQEWITCEEATRASLKLYSNDPILLEILGVSLLNQRKGPEAVEAFTRAYIPNPISAQGWYRLGSAHLIAHEIELAVEALETAVRLNPEYPEALVNLALAYRCQEKITEAINSLEHAARIRPDYAEAHFNHGTMLLLYGQWEEGFAEFEWRDKIYSCAPKDSTKPRWDGSSLEGKTLLVVAEQGMGDVLLLSRYFPFLSEMGAQVILQCHAPLIPLLKHLPFLKSVVPIESPTPEHDCYIPIFSLPGMFQTTPYNIPVPINMGFDAPASGHIQRVGLVWAGNPQHDDDHYRSCPEEEFLRLLDLPNLEFVKLQHGDNYLLANQAVQEGRLQASESADFLELAQNIGGLDLVITVDTAVVHLAGILGVPTWLLLARPCDWRWGLSEAPPPWYSSIRLFRQPIAGDWKSLIARVSEELSASAQ